MKSRLTHLVKEIICKLLRHRAVDLGWRHNSETCVWYLTKCSRCRRFNLCIR